MEELDKDRYGSVTKEIQDLVARKRLFFSPPREMCHFNHTVTSSSLFPISGLDRNMTSQSIIDLDSEDEVDVPAAISAERTQTHSSQNIFRAPESNNILVMVDSGAENGDHIGHKPEYSHEPHNCGLQMSSTEQQVGSQMQTRYHAKQDNRRNSTTRNQGIKPVRAQMNPSYDSQSIFLKKADGETPTKDILGDQRKRKIEKEGDRGICGETPIERSKGVYVGVQDVLMSNSQRGEDDGLGDIWMEMSLAIECSKDASLPLDTAIEHTAAEEEEDECEHSFVLKDDLGYVCRICGVIEKSIEQIFDFQWGKGSKTTRGSYMSQSRNAKDGKQVEGSKFTVQNLMDQDFGVADISVHPRHMKKMKPHQLEGFNFLLGNLVSDNPGGCILAHAPGSGKTFMVISFLQSFLAKYPDARPLVVLPKGIVSTWKREVKIWQIEEIPLYDLYTKADSRAEQLVVLKQWVERRGILFVGYQQFAIIISNSTSSDVAAACHEILLKVPTLLILDEGHTPRNESTDLLYSLSQVQTPRKVVLSGTLFQNNVKEVFNILNLVRPKFMKLDTSKAIVRRVMSRVQIGPRKQIKSGVADTLFFDLVEETLQNDQDFRRKVTVIQDLREMTSKVLHYYKGDFLDELPGLVDLTVVLNLSPKQKLAVQKLRKLEYFKRSSMGSAVYVHPRLKEHSESFTTGEKGHINEAKIDELLSKIDITDGVKAKFFLNILGLCESAGEKLLVFSQFRLPLKFLERLVVQTKGWSLGKEIFVISGDSSPGQRELSMDRFNTSQDAKVFFGSIKACGEGISLVGASRLLILDIHLNPSVTRQAIGRAFRPGQTKRVYAYRLVAADSPEEEDHDICFRKELISKMWFEWSEICGYHDFSMEEVDKMDLGDSFWNSSSFGEDVKALYRR
ncbi:hypothetical protein MKW94_019795 [Papaver nudicaule]|uniref:Uncharacterized protein n=1 Tax=Papaver nudicaule TaxID=74823 RepID=A0AA41W1A4_PAPNU|nr:hypothetical protein [Papaver nudicaule]